MKCYCALVLLIGAVAAARRPAHFKLRAPFLPKDTPKPKAQWVDQKLDHFTNGSTSTWKQRYFVNQTWWDKENGPVFFQLGGEGPANPNWIVADTDMMINAKKYKALVFSIEHRFYGESHPTKDVSVANLKYLSSRQALADFAYFHDLMVKQYKLTDRNKWISFGGSYSGALSAWLRQTYPKAVIAAVASSAPVLAKLDFVEYIEVVEKSLGTKGSDCPSTVAQATADLSTMLQDKKNWPQVEKMFHVKPALETDLDVSNLLETLAGNFEGIVQYNRDNTLFEGRPNNITIEMLCDMMSNTTLGSALERYAAVNRFMMGKDEDLDCSYSAMIKEMKEDSWKSDTVLEGERQWTYQTCTEFGYFQTTDSTATSLFSDGIGLSFYTDMCTQVFGIEAMAVHTAINATNHYYGGRNVTGTNIVFPNGSIDPWHALSILTDIGSSVHAVFITGTAHCANMYPPRDSDLQGLTDARAEISNLIGKWLGGS